MNIDGKHHGLENLTTKIYVYAHITIYIMTGLGRDITDLLGEDYYDYYEDYATGSGLLARIRTAIRWVSQTSRNKFLRNS